MSTASESSRRSLLLGLCLVAILAAVLWWWLSSPVAPVNDQVPASDPGQHPSPSTPPPPKSQRRIHVPGPSPEPGKPGSITDADTPAELDDTGPEPPPSARIMALTPDGQVVLGAQIVLTGCTYEERTDIRAGVQLVGGTGSCTAQGFRSYGSIEVSSPPVRFDFEDGKDIFVALEVPDNPQEGVGLELSMNNGAAWVISVQPGSVAAEAGIQAEDAILAIDGVRLDEITDISDLQDLIVGDPDTQVGLIVRTPGDNGPVDRTVILTRGQAPEPTEDDDDGDD